MATDILPWYEEEARERQKATQFGGEGNISTTDAGKARDKLGETIGVSGRYIQDAKKLKEENPGVFEKVRTGEITIADAKKELRKQRNSSKILDYPCQGQCQTTKRIS